MRGGEQKIKYKAKIQPGDTTPVQKGPPAYVKLCPNEWIFTHFDTQGATESFWVSLGTGLSTSAGQALITLALELWKYSRLWGLLLPRWWGAVVKKSQVQTEDSLGGQHTMWYTGDIL